MTKITESFEYFVVIRAGDRNDIDEAARAALSPAAASLLENYSMRVRFDGNDTDWYGDVWSTYKIRFDVPPTTKLLLDMLEEQKCES